MASSYVLPDNIIAFAGSELIAKGAPSDVALATKRLIDARDSRIILIYDAETSRPVEIDFRGSVADVLARLPEPVPAEDNTGPGEVRRGPGRPKLGVVAREVTLLPRHWEWLASQPGGASVTMRKLVEAARKQSAQADRLREARESINRFALAMAGDEPGFEEATRALYGNERERFDSLVEAWPPDVRDHVRELADSAFSDESATED